MPEFPLDDHDLRQISTLPGPVPRTMHEFLALTSLIDQPQKK